MTADDRLTARRERGREDPLDRNGWAWIADPSRWIDDLVDREERAE
jgi:hypothetical protein